jgi:hypothetical protein
MQIEIKKLSTESQPYVITVPVENFPQEIKDKLFVYGLTQKINDSHSQIAKKVKGVDNPDYSDAAVADAVNAVIQGFLDGEWSQRGSGDGATRIVDPITATAKRLAMSHLDGVIASRGLRKVRKATEQTHVSVETYNATVAKMLAQEDGAWQKAAKKALEESAKKATLGADYLYESLIMGRDVAA